MLKALLLDFDGTIVDSEGVAGQAIENVLKAHGFPFLDEYHQVAMGRTWASAVEILHEKIPEIIPKKGQEWLKNALKAEYKKLRDLGVPLVPGAGAAIRALKEHFQLAIVTGSARDEVEDLLQHHQLLDVIPLVIASEDYTEGKPSPEPFLLALKKLGLKPQDAMIFEDSYAGAAAAITAKIPFVHVRHCSPIQGLHPGAAAEIQDWRQVNVEWVHALGKKFTP